MKDDLHLQADLFFGPCNDPDCPGAQLVSGKPRLELVWPTRDRQSPAGGESDPLDI